jgi:hypothetical protein
MATRLKKSQLFFGKGQRFTADAGSFAIFHFVLALIAFDAAFGEADHGIPFGHAGDQTAGKRLKSS